MAFYGKQRILYNIFQITGVQGGATGWTKVDMSTQLF